ncbi:MULTISPECIES: hypothetical protein [unclassified Streptomyces]|uniref:hypothetical protein n=1 Tax=unclassified Streptomyces TaxID=2593676 RepID=UPI003659F0FA
MDEQPVAVSRALIAVLDRLARSGSDHLCEGLPCQGIEAGVLEEARELLQLGLPCLLAFARTFLGGMATLRGCSSPFLGFLAATLGVGGPLDGFGPGFELGAGDGQVLVGGSCPPHRAVHAGVDANLLLKDPLDRVTEGAGYVLPLRLRLQGARRPGVAHHPVPHRPGFAPVLWEAHPQRGYDALPWPVL